MTSENFEFSDVSDHKYNSETKLTMEERKGRGGSGSGCFVSTTLAVFLVIVAVILAVGVGLIVFFAADGRSVVCKCDGGSSSSLFTSGEVKEKCMFMAEKGDADVCNKCSSGKGATTGGPATTASPTDQPKITDVRLPTSVSPVHYTIRLQPYMYTQDVDHFTFKGTVSIHIRCVEPTDNVTLHIKELAIDLSSLRFEGLTASSSDPTVVSTEEDLVREFFILKLSKNMVKDGEYVVSMDYTGPLNATLKGLYLSSYERNGEKVYLASTQFQPTDARRAFPCFDEPAIKATFNVTLVRKKELISISNTPIKETSTQWTESGVTYVADVYEQTPKMSTYLLAFVICDFDYTSGVAKNNITYRAFSRPEVTNSTKYALDVGLKVLPYFETYFETDYPLPKQDMIAIPDFAAGAMENWGLITYRETAMLYDPLISNEGNKERVAIVVSHELAHQWFGDLVTLAWWDDLWLNEGFATFVEYMGVDFVEPSWKMFEKFVISDVQKVFTKDGYVTSHPVFVPVNHPDEINEIFDAISYSKGGSIIRMMRHFLGFETFRKGLVRYLHDRKFDIAVHDDLWSFLEQQATADGKDIKVKEIMDTWTLQMNYPVVTVTRDPNNPNNVHVTQSRFLSDPNAEDPLKYTSPFGYKWSIPITLTSSVNPNFVLNDTDVIWMYKDETEKNFNIGAANLPPSSDTNGWILANTEQNGFYRVNYEQANWMALIHQLNTDHNVISTINRAQIINDAWSFTKPNLLSINIALDTVEYLDKELSYVPWSAATTELGYVSRMISLTSTYGYFKRFMLEKTTNPFNHYGLNNTGSGHRETSIRRIITSQACGYGNENCTTQAVGLYTQWMADSEKNKIDPDLKYIVYCMGIKYGGWDEWNFAMNMLLSSKVASEQDTLRSALACTRKDWILNHYLNLILAKDSPIRSQDALSVIGSISPSAVRMTWDFYRANFDQLAASFSSSFFAWSQVIESITDRFNTPFQLEQLINFMELKKDTLGTATSAFGQAVEKVSTNIKWMATNYPGVKAWFENKYK